MNQTEPTLRLIFSIVINKFKKKNHYEKKCSFCFGCICFKINEKYFDKYKYLFVCTNWPIVSVEFFFFWLILY